MDISVRTSRFPDSAETLSPEANLFCRFFPEYRALAARTAQILKHLEAGPICRCRVPPTRITEPPTIPPPRTQSTSSIPVSNRSPLRNDLVDGQGGYRRIRRLFRNGRRFFPRRTGSRSAGRHSQATWPTGSHNPGRKDGFAGFIPVFPFSL